MISYEYVEFEERGGKRIITYRVITDWPPGEKRQRTALKVRLIMLAGVDRNQAVGSLIFKTKTEGIYYAKMRGNVALRPRLCLGPTKPDEEVTFLERATEVNFKVVPKDACERARARMKKLENDDSQRLLIRLDELA
ncbi:MAG TPA: hypothetical protein VF789_32975 [Thermoanaerobaculia bacterium]